MSVSSFFHRSGKVLTDNSPAILTAIGVTGAVTTAVLAGKASFKAAEILAEAEKDRAIENGNDAPLDVKEKVLLVWTLYIPAVSSLALTTTSIILANRIGTRRAAALATAYKLSEQAFDRYKDKVVEKMGATKEQKVRDEIAQDQVTQNPPVNREIVITGKGDVLCKDGFSGRYLRSTIEDLKHAQNKINYQVNNNYYASLTDFYELIGLERTTVSDELGWNSSERLLELNFSGTITPEGEPCVVFEFVTSPIRDFYKMC